MPLSAEVDECWAESLIPQRVVLRPPAFVAPPWSLLKMHTPTHPPTQDLLSQTLHARRSPRWTVHTI